MYIGEIDNDPNNNFIKKSDTVERYVDTKIVEQIRDEKARINAQIQYQRQQAQQRENQAKAEFDKRIAFDINEQKRRDAIEKQQRIENAYLRQQGNSYRANDGKIYTNYDGININTGEILRLRKFNKVGKDSEGRYLYTGYINNTPNEHDAEMLSYDGTPMGVSVCFSTDIKMEDIVEQNNPIGIKKLLELFSAENNFKYDNGYMNYIGAIDKTGEILTNDNSQEMWSAINSLQNKAYNKMQQKNRETDGQEWTQ